MTRWLARGAVAVAVVAALALAWAIVRGTVAQSLVHVDPEESVAWNGRNADALVALAEAGLTTTAGVPDAAAVRELGLRALRSEPWNEPALRVLALADDLDGADARAEVLMNLAAQRSPRDLGAEVWLFDQRVKAGKVTDALKAADIILRLRPDVLNMLLPALTDMATNDTSRPALIAALGAGPPWRSAVLAALASSATPATNNAVIVGLQDSAHPLEAAEIGPYLDRLIGEGQYELSFLTWLRSLPVGESDQLPYVYNGDFELPPTGLPFDWSIGKIDGATTELVDTGDKDHGVALHVVFAGARVAYHHVAKLLLLPPGTYRLNGMVKADDIENARGVVWRMFCADAPDQTLGTTPAVTGTNDWTSFTASFEVPPTGCRAQWLRLEVAASVAIEQQISGTIWYDKLSIQRVDTPAAAEEPPASSPGPT
jgi:hypothetical protein